jgi:hypothetical protein
MASSAKSEHFRKWVFWTGIFNIVAYLPLSCPYTLKIFMDTMKGLNQALGLGGSMLSLPLSVNNLLMINLLGVIIVFLGIFLIIASFDIENRAWFVFWEGLARILVFVIIVYFVLFKSAAHILVAFGVIDLIIGIIYMYYIFTIEGLKTT